MSAPSELSIAALKRLGRYLEGHRRLIYEYPRQEVTHIEVYSDTDWAGCPRTRKSTSGGCTMLGVHMTKSWSSTQPNPALSSGEAEYYGLVKAAGIGLGYQALMKDLKVDLPLRLWTDSSAAIGVSSRQGVGKTRHLDTRTLWIQQAVRTGRIEIRKVKGTENPADLFTKHIPTAEKIGQLVSLFGCRFEEGRAACAPKMRRDRLTQKTLGNTECHNLEGDICDIDHLPHTKAEAYEKYTPPEEEYLDNVEGADGVEDYGLEIAKSIQDQSEQFGRRRKFE